MLLIRSRKKLKIGFGNLSIVFLSIYYFWFFLPYMRTTFTGIYKYIFFAFFAIGVVLLLIENIRVYGLRIKVKHTILVPIIIYMLMMLVLVLLDSKDASNHIRVSFTFWGSALVYYLMGVDEEKRCRFTIFLAIIVFFTTITSFIGILQYPSAARALANSNQSAESLAEDYILGRKNISSIYLYQCITMLAPVFVVLIKKKHIVLGTLGLVFSFIIVLQASFTIAIVVLMLGIVTGMLHKRNALRMITITAVFVLLLLLPWSDILRSMAEVIENSYVSQRMQELAHLLSVGEVVGDTAGRSEAYRCSFETFLAHPLGVGAYYTYNLGENGIGYHSQILDDFARFGIIALAFYCVFFWRYYLLLKQKWEMVGMGDVALPILIQYIALLALNIGFRSAEESVFMFFLLPLIPEIYLHYKERKRGDFVCP